MNQVRERGQNHQMLKFVDLYLPNNRLPTPFYHLLLLYRQPAVSELSGVSWHPQSSLLMVSEVVWKWGTQKRHPRKHPIGSTVWLNPIYYDSCEVELTLVSATHPHGHHWHYDVEVKPYLVWDADSCGCCKVSRLSLQCLSSHEQMFSMRQQTLLP